MKFDIVLADTFPTAPANILVAACGYESRSTEFLHKLDTGIYSSIIIADYGSYGVFSYDDNNRKIRREIDDSILAFHDSAHVAAALSTLIRSNDGASIEIDISSFDRATLAQIFIGIFSNASSVTSVKLHYFAQRFLEPDLRKLETVRAFGPVSPFLAGQPSSGSRSLCLIFGAGHELGKAIGAIDTLEPDEIYCFKPYGIDQRYDSTILRANMDFEFIENKDNIISYDLEDPFGTYMQLRSLVEVKARNSSVVILPLGPKLYAAISIIVALIYHPSVKVWRHSTVSNDDPSTQREATASGHHIYFAFQFVPKVANLGEL
ncbi:MULTISPECIES: hypothetical protein [unclassified Mesorhizobium]|uniref:hypothetical protein n=1 Tax=unclassified Mesorhizobium TaxID=325217 RepID=UPI00112ACE1D|nr:MULTISPECIES: hypothetical protein [unclassified Mesorhizobium]TPN47746.1 hypothetical protein FJ978_22875 [Mesorhizobium sp. B1-1-7]TPN58391.1 hypothetical protein FJ976_00260 [Mesorhizobium sp. B1-1-9]